MNAKKQIRTLFSVVLCFFLFSCAEKAQEKTEEAQAVVPVEEPAKKEVPKLSAEMNPLNVYRDYTKVFADTLDIQMYELILKPGDSLGFHGHLDHTVYVLQGGKAIVYLGGNDPHEMEFKAGEGFIAGPMTDVAKNVGDTEIRLLINEIYRPRIE